LLSLRELLSKMTDSFLFIENSKNIAIYQDFVKFRKDSFHYILNLLVKEKHFTTKLEAGKNLKSKFNQFYGKDKKDLEFKDYVWKCETFLTNFLEKEEKKKEKENYNTQYTKIKPKKIATSCKVLNTPLAYIELESLYGV